MQCCFATWWRLQEVRLQSRDETSGHFGDVQGFQQGVFFCEPQDSQVRYMRNQTDPSPPHIHLRSCELAVRDEGKSGTSPCLSVNYWFFVVARSSLRTSHCLRMWKPAPVLQ